MKRIDHLYYCLPLQQILFSFFFCCTLTITLSTPKLASAQSDIEVSIFIDSVTIENNPLLAHQHVLRYIDSPSKRYAHSLLKVYLDKFHELNDSNVVKLYLNTAFVCHKLNYFIESKSYLDSARDRLNNLGQLPSSSRMLHGLYNTSLFYFLDTNNADSALYYASLALSESKRIGYASGEIEALIGFGEIQFFLLNGYDSSIIYLYDAYALAESTGDTLRMIDICYTTGKIYQQTGYYDKAIQRFSLGLNFSTHSTFQALLYTLYFELSDTFASKGIRDSSIYFSKKIMELQTKIPNYEYQYKAASQLGIQYYFNGQIDKSFEHFKIAVHAAIQACELRSSPVGCNEVVKAINNLNQLYEVNKQYDSMKYWLSIASNYIDSTNANHLVIANRNLADIALAELNYKEASKYLQEVIKYNKVFQKKVDSIRQAYASANLEEVETKYETAKKEQAISRLEWEADLKSKQNLVLIIGIGFLIVVAIVVLLLYRRIVHKNKLLDVTSQNLNESNRTKDKLFSMISHDLRRPMDNLSILIQLMENRDTAQLIHDSPNFINDLKGEFDKVNLLMRDLLFWAIKQKDALIYSPDIVKLNVLVLEQISLFSPVIRNKDINVKHETEEVNLSTDKEMLRFIIRNLLSNAINHTPEGGRIVIKSSWQEDSYLIEVSDTGPGISLEKQNALFEVGFNLDMVNISKQGAGVGLSLCADLAGRMGASLYLDSRVSDGTTFILSINRKNVISNGTKINIKEKIL